MIYFILLAFHTMVSPQEIETYELLIKVTNIEVHTGELKVAVFNNQEDHLKRSIKSGQFKVTHETWLNCTFELPYGEYSFTMYQDVDLNDELNSNFIGIPNEPYAFSNNASIMFGPPSYDKSKFTFSEDHQIVEVKLK